MNLACNAQKMRSICLKFSLKCVESHKNSEIVDFLMLIISCLFPYRVGTYRQVLTKYMITNNMGTFYTVTID